MSREASAKDLSSKKSWSTFGTSRNALCWEEDTPPGCCSPSRTNPTLKGGKKCGVRVFWCAPNTFHLGGAGTGEIWSWGLPCCFLCFWVPSLPSVHSFQVLMCRRPRSSTACGLKTELGEIDDSLTGSCSPLPFVSLFVPKISNPRTLTVTSFGNFDRKAFYREIIKSWEKSKFNKRNFLCTI